MIVGPHRKALTMEIVCGLDLTSKVLIKESYLRRKKIDKPSHVSLKCTNFLFDFNVKQDQKLYRYSLGKIQYLPLKTCSELSLCKGKK